MGCGGRLTRALEGLDGVESVQLRFADREVDVRFDPTRLGSLDLLTAIEKISFTPSPKSVSVGLAGGKVSAETGATSLSLESGGDSPAEGRYEIEAPASIEVGSPQGDLDASAASEIGLSVGRDAKPGWVEIRVHLKAGEDESVLRVPYRIAR